MNSLLISTGILLWIGVLSMPPVSATMSRTKLRQLQSVANMVKDSMEFPRLGDFGDNEGDEARQLIEQDLSGIRVSPVKPSLVGHVNRLAATTAAVESADMAYYGGAVMVGPRLNLYIIWYGQPFTEAQKDIIRDSVQAMNPGNGDVARWWALTRQYSDTGVPNQGNLPPAAITMAGEVDNAGTMGTTVTGPNIVTIIKGYLDSGALPVDDMGVYNFITNKDVMQVDTLRDPPGTFKFCQDYCGWHDQFVYGGKSLKFAFAGNADQSGCRDSCIADIVLTDPPNGDTGMDALTSIFMHEVAEAVTNPGPLLAYYDKVRKLENADLCAWRYGTMANYNMVGPAPKQRKWLIQQQLSLISRNCESFYGGPQPIVVEATNPHSTPSGPTRGATRVPDPNLIQNGDFETGDLRGWEYNPTSPLAVKGATGFEHSGSRALRISCAGKLCSISQPIQTTIGAKYDLSFWLAVGAGLPNQVVVRVNSINLLDKRNLTASSQPQLVNITFTATTTPTYVQLWFRNDAGPLHLDAVRLLKSATAGRPSPVPRLPTPKLPSPAPQGQRSPPPPAPQAKRPPPGSRPASMPPRPPTVTTRPPPPRKPANPHSPPPKKKKKKNKKPKSPKPPKAPKKKKNKKHRASPPSPK